MENLFNDYKTWVIVLFVFLIVFDVILKLIALWRSARLKQLVWFICIGIFNTCGILPIIYLLITRKKKDQTCCSNE